MKKKEIAEHLDAIGHSLTTTRIISVNKSVSRNAMSAGVIGIQIGIAIASAMLDGELEPGDPSTDAVIALGALSDMLTRDVADVEKG